MVELWETGLMDYSEKLDKPVKYTEQHLKELASKTSTVDITNGHSDEIIGNMSNFTYNDGVLSADVSSNVDIKGLGLSPIFNVNELIDKGDYLYPWDIEIINVGLVDSPRNKLLFNSIKEEEVEEVSKETIDALVKKQEELERTIGSLQTQIKQKDKMISEKEDFISEYKSKVEELSNGSDEIEQLKAKAAAYDEIEVNKREELLNKISEGNDKIKEDFKDLDYATLVKLDKAKILDNPGRGTPSTGNPNVDDGNDLPPADDVYSQEEFEKDLAAIGLK
ncbi:hypothetical protein [Methanobrevibacter sp. DSM 116169]|uniref:hypothetical protein n=1 Tax=Methanobrevibacter sp. DSM 116169 TaxID=3242727 RepID=UPI0038FC319D